MFKRRSSKDLSVKIGYDNVNGKPSKHSAAQTGAANVPLTKQGPSFSSSSNPPRKSTGTLSPEGSNEASSSLAAIKSLPPANNSDTDEVQPLQQDQVVAHGVATAISKVPSSNGKASSSAAASATRVAAEPPSKSLVIGEGVLFEGATEGCTAAVVGGKLVGTVKSERLEITRAGRMEGLAVVETAEIAGTFEGRLLATKALKILSTGRVKGEVSFGSIVVENGGKLEGTINVEGMREPEPEPEPEAGETGTESPPSSTPAPPPASTTALPPTSTATPSEKPVAKKPVTKKYVAKRPAAKKPVDVAAAAAPAAPLYVRVAPRSTVSTPTPSEDSPVARLPSVSSFVAKLQSAADSRASPE